MKYGLYNKDINEVIISKEFKNILDAVQYFFEIKKLKALDFGKLFEVKEIK